MIKGTIYEKRRQAVTKNITGVPIHPDFSKKMRNNPGELIIRKSSPDYFEKA